MSTIPILVTGGCGFLGTSIIFKLLETKKFKITALDINPPSPGIQTFVDSVHYVRCDILDPAALRETFQEARPTVVVHTVGIYPLGMKRYSMVGKEAVFKINVDGTRNVLEASKACGTRGLVYTSTVAVVLDELTRDFKNVDETWPTGRAKTSYGMSKAFAEDLVAKANTKELSTCILRPAPILGANDIACIPAIHSCIAAGQTPFILGSATNLQDFVYIENVADAHVLAVMNLLGSKTAAGEIMFVTNGEPVVARDLYMAIWKAFGHIPPYQITIPEGLAWWMAWGAEWASLLIGKRGTFIRGFISDACRNRYVSIQKAQEILGYTPRVSLEEGLRISCEFYQKQIEARTRK